MWARYRAAFAPPGSLAFSVAGFFSRFVIAVYPIAIVLIVSDRTGEYGFAGLVSGVYVLGCAFGNPVSAHLTDRLGQHRTIPPFLAATVAATLAFGLLVRWEAPLWSFLPPAFLMGATLMDIGALVRARWSYVWAATAPQRMTAYSIESSVDELIFVVGPLTGTVLVLHLSTLVALGLLAVVLAAGRLWLASQRQTEPPVGHHETSGVPAALRHRGMGLVACFSLFVGGLFGAGEVTMVAFCGQHGQRGSSGWVLGAFALGSGLAGISYGAVQWRASLLRRLVIASAAFGALPLLYLCAYSVTSLTVIAAFVGVATAPTLIGLFGLVDRLVPISRLTSGLTWVGTGVSVGYGLGAASVGSIADRHGAHTAFVVPIVSALAVSVTAVALTARLGTSIDEKAGSPRS